MFITIIGVNEPPVANNDQSITQEDTPVTFDILDNDTDPDEDVYGCEVELLVPSTGPSNGGVTYNGDGTVTYTPNPDYFGRDSFNYRLCCSDDQCDDAVGKSWGTHVR